MESFERIYQIWIFTNNLIQLLFNCLHWLFNIIFICHIILDINCYNIHIRYKKKFISLIIKISNDVYQNFFPKTSRFLVYKSDSIQGKNYY